MKINKLLSLIAIGLSTCVFAAPPRKIELVGTFVSTSTTTFPSSEIKVVTINCALVSTNVCATLTVPEYVVPGTTPQSFPVEGDIVEKGQVFHLETPIHSQTGTFVNVSQTTNTSTSIKSTEIEAKEINYNDFITAPTKEIEVIGLYRSVTTTQPIIVTTPGGTATGSQTKVYCALVSANVCFTLEVADLAIPPTVNPQTHNGPLPLGYYKSLKVNGATISGQFYNHFQAFTDETLTEREHTFQYVPTPPVVAE